MRKRRDCLVLILLCALVVRGSAPVHAAPINIVDLTALIGSDAFVSGINASGQLAGYIDALRYMDGTPVDSQHAFLYTGAAGSGTLADLGTLSSAISPGTSGYNSYGRAINDSGEVAGTSDTTGNDLEHAFLYTGAPGSGGMMYDLGALGTTYSHANAINNSGQVTGDSETFSDADHAFLYSGTPTSGGSMVDLGTLGGTLGHNVSVGMAINDGGQVVGYSDVANGSTHAFLYSGTPGHGGAMMDLGTLGGLNSEALAVNGAGQITGYSETTGDATSDAFLYSGTPGSGGKMFDLGSLGGNSTGYDINSAGLVVGGSYLANNADPMVQHAFLYSGTPGVNGQMIDLNTWLAATDPSSAAAWTLGDARVLTDSGLIIGDGIYNNGGSSSQDVYLLDASSLISSLPEPSRAALAALCGLAVLRRGRRRHRVAGAIQSQGR